jgi:iron complex outermembrane receptor protein
MLYDFSGTIGRNETEFFLNNTWSPSFGPDGIIDGQLQRNFDIGSYTETDTSLNADFVMPIAVDAFASDLNFAFGAEWRNEQFQVRIGEENSWAAGDFAFMNSDPANPNFYNDGTTQMINLSIGAHGFAGFSPPQAGRFDRANYAVYVDFEADVTERFTAGVAVRFELAITDTFAVRGSFSTGFRAPTPGQSNVTKVSTLTIDGELIQNGQIPPTNPIAMALGAQALLPEDATNFTVGAVFDLTDSISVTVDYYNIELEDRIAQTGNIDISAEPALTDGSCPVTAAGGGSLSQCLQESGVPGAADLTSIRFFTNDFETTTQGVDLVATWALDWGNAGSGDLTAAWAWTDTEVDKVGEEVSRNRIHDLENENPEQRGIFTYNHYIGDLRLMARASYYGEFAEGSYSGDPTFVGPAPGEGRVTPVYTQECLGTDLGGGLTDFNDKCYDGEWIFDIEGAYTFNETWSIIAGVNNVADTFGPADRDNLDGTIGSGNAYETSTPWGYDGGFWYFRLRADFD